jgi:hypothetical protein
METINRGEPEKKKKRGLREFFSLGEVGAYFFRKKDPNRPVNTNIKIMHGINKFSIIIFLLAIIFLVLKRLFS